MPIGTPQLIGTAGTSAASTTLSITVPAGGVPAGAAIIVAVANHNNLAPTSVTDSAGNTYTVHLSPANGTTVTISIASALNVAALTSGQTITVTWSSGRNAAMSAYYVTGIATSSALDQTASNTAGSGTAATVGPSSTTTQADELVIGAFGYSGTRTFTAGTGYTALTGAESTTTIRGVAWDYQIVSATGAQTATGTFNSTVTYAGALATFKAAAGGSTPISASDTITATDAASIRNTTPSTADSATAADSASVRNITPSAVDTITATDAVSIRSTSPVVSDTITATDAASVTVVAPPAPSAPQGGRGQRLFLGVFDKPNGTLILDASPKASAASFSTGGTGFATCEFFYPMSLADAFRMYDLAGLPHVLLTDGVSTVYEGRLEDRRLAFKATDGGVILRAFGYWRSLTDIPYTALWSTTKTDRWRSLTANDIPADAAPDRFQFDSRNRLYITATKNSTQGQARIGYLGFRIPYNSSRQIVQISFDYGWSNQTGWQIGLQTRSSTWTFTNNIWTVNGGGVASGSVTLTAGSTTGFSATDALTLFLRFNATDAVFSGENGEVYVQLTNVRVSTSASVTARDIASDLVAQTRGNNPDQLSADLSQIQATGLNLTDEIDEDASMANLLTRLTTLGDNQTPPRRWEVGVYENRQLYLRPRGSAGRQWFIDIGELELERTIDTLINSVYGLYRATDNNELLRTTIASDNPSIARYGLIRRAAISADIATPNVLRDAALQDGKDPAPRTRITVPAIYDANGARWPLYLVRSGDTLTIRNLPPALSTSIDRIRTFRVAETTYRLDSDTLEVTPEVAIPTLSTIVARLGAGFGDGTGNRIGTTSAKPALGFGSKR